jgi:murein DD-endopeptidase MepM/ murein hydrolase activator NlpD
VSIWSLKAPLAYMYATEGWMHPRAGRSHQSLDLRAPVGTPAYAMDGGVVRFAGKYSDGSGGPLALEIDHGDFVTRYLHLSRLDVPQGARVARGQQIGVTGLANSPHLHADLWAVPGLMAAYVARFGKPVGLGQTKTFSGKAMVKLPLEPLVPATYQQDVIDGAIKGNVKLYRSSWRAVAALGLLGLGVWAAWRYFRQSPALPPSATA